MSVPGRKCVCRALVAFDHTSEFIAMPTIPSAKHVYRSRITWIGITTTHVLIHKSVIPTGIAGIQATGK